MNTLIETQRQKVAELETRLRIEQEKLDLLIKYPLKTKVYIHGDEDSMYSEGKKLGLSEVALETFFRVGYEVTFDVEVEESGQAFATHVNGTALVERVEI